MTAVLLLAGCVAPPAPVRELYTEARTVEGEQEEEAPGTKLRAYPLDAEVHEAYVAVRRLDGVEEGVEELFAAAGGGAQLVFPSIEGALRRVSVVYVGHAAFAERLEVWHHLRLFVVNREPHPLLVALGDLACASASEPELVAATNRQRERIEDLWAVEPGEARTLHLFYRTRNVDPRLSFAFALRAPPGPGGEASVGPWLFAVELTRDYVLQGVELTELERMVVRGETLPVATTPPDPWAEPLLTPVPGPPAEADAGDGAGG